MLAVVLLAACGGQAAETTTAAVAVEQPSTTTSSSTTTTVAETTTTEAGSVSLSAGRTVVLEPGVDYASDGFLVPLAWRVEDDGWRWYGVGEDWAYLALVLDGDLAAALALLGYRSWLPSGEVVEAIVGREEVTVVEGPTVATVAGVEAITVDVEGAPEQAQVNDERNGCTGGIGRFFLDEPGYARVVESRSTNPKEYGIASCKVSRVWVFETNGSSVTVIGGAVDPDRFDELMPLAERLLDTMSFEAP